MVSGIRRGIPKIKKAPLGAFSFVALHIASCSDATETFLQESSGNTGELIGESAAALAKLSCRKVFLAPRGSMPN